MVLRHENAVLRRHVKRVRYEPADRDIVLIFIEHGTRRLHIAGVTPNPTGSWVAQQARNLAMDLAISMDTLRFLVRDRDTKYTAAFDEVFGANGIQVIKTPPRAPPAGRKPSAGSISIPTVVESSTRYVTTCEAIIPPLPGPGPAPFRTRPP